MGIRQIAAAVGLMFGSGQNIQAGIGGVEPERRSFHKNRKLTKNQRYIQTRHRVREMLEKERLARTNS